MALKALKCPNCDANVQVDEENDFGFCSYCGAHIQIREIVEVRYSGEVYMNDTGEDSYVKKLEKGKAYLKMEDYYKAEQSFYQVIREHPGQAEAYEMLIRAITRNHTVYIRENLDRVMKLAEKMVAVAPPKKKTRYQKEYDKLLQNFETGIAEQVERDAIFKVARLNKMMKESAVFLALALVAGVLCFLFLNGNNIFTMAMVVIGIFAVFSILSIVICKLSIKKIMKKTNDL